MPSKSKAQRNFMAAAAHNPAFAKKVGIPTSVAKEFNQADKGKTFKQGGETMKHEKAVAKKAVGMHDKQMHGGKKTDLTKLKKGGMAKGYAAGGMPMVEKDGKKVPAFAADGKGKMAKGGKVMKYAEGGTVKPSSEKKEPIPSDIKDKMQDMKNEKAYQNYQKTKKLAKGGGIEVRGKTRGKMC
jgi:hypothetical protein